MSRTRRFSPAALALVAWFAACNPDSPAPTGPGTDGETSLKADAGEIDLSRLQPALFPGLDWSCGWVAHHGQIFCRGVARPFEVLDPFTAVVDCGDGGSIYEKSSHDLIAKRYYGSDYRLLRRVLHRTGDGTYSRHPDGSAPTASIRINFFETNEYSIPGNMDDGVTTTLRGTENEIRLDAPGHPILALDKGELRIDPSGGLTIVSGRWDFFTDEAGTNARICAALK